MHTTDTRIHTVGLAAILLLAGVPAAFADAIDGNWCSADGRHLSIAGPSITTPGGKHMAGDYSRHAFSYIAPDGEEGAGTAINMRLMSEDEMRMFVSSAMPAVWHRCRAETS